MHLYTDQRKVADIIAAGVSEASDRGSIHHDAIMRVMENMARGYARQFSVLARQEFFNACNLNHLH